MKFKGQSVQKIEWKQTDGRTQPIALPFLLTRSVITATWLSVLIGADSILSGKRYEINTSELLCTEQQSASAMRGCRNVARSGRQNRKWSLCRRLSAWYWTDCRLSLACRWTRDPYWSLPPSVLTSTIESLSGGNTGRVVFRDRQQLQHQQPHAYTAVAADSSLLRCRHYRTRSSATAERPRDALC